MHPITLEEVDATMHEMDLGKSARPNGFRIYFFHHC